jgi:hypothetical protein
MVMVAGRWQYSKLANDAVAGGQNGNSSEFFAEL